MADTSALESVHKGLIPADKNLDPNWVKSLFDRGTPSVRRGADLKYIGMPIGGICTGQLYLSGEGKLWHWDIFNILVNSGCDGPRYVDPFVPTKDSPVDQGFAIQIGSGDDAKIYPLDLATFPDLTFLGEYPIGTVEYRNSKVPLEITLEAFSPFIPLNADDSGLPATVLHFTVKNTSSDPVEATLAGWLENAVCPRQKAILGGMLRRNLVVQSQGLTFLNGSIEAPVETGDQQADILVEDWNKESYDGWTVEGTAFGTGPIEVTKLPAYMGKLGGDTDRVANSHASAPGSTGQERDAQVGKLTSKPFTIERTYINAWIGGGGKIEQTAFHVLVDGKKVAGAAGTDSNIMERHAFDVSAWKGKQAVIEIVDAGSGGWGNIGVGRISQSNKAITADEVKKVSDYGTMGLALLGAPAEHAMVSDVTHGFGGKTDATATVPGDKVLTGALGRKLSLKPGESATVDFVVTWNFPNLKLPMLGDVGRYYAARFPSAQTVAQYVADNFERLTTQTRLWRNTWYDSTLPYWFLDRTFSSVSTLATSTPYRFASGRFYSWEGVGCCEGTCAHVWLYAQSVGRVFPELERITRENIDYGLALDPKNGVIGFRCEFDRSFAVDGQAGILMRTYREHQMSPDGSFLKRVWPKVKKAFDPLLALDADRDGILEGAQMNTLDTPWFGQISWLSSLYLGALRAGEQMALEMGDDEFAKQCRTIAENGTKSITEKLFNGEYFINKIDPQHAETTNSGTGCEIDQVLGQSWALQIGLPRILPEKETRSALQSIWKYNYAMDIGPYIKVYNERRVYAVAGEPGTQMCTFPQPGWDYQQARGKSGFARYFNECWTGTEHQVAGHMIGEGLVQEGLAIERAIHDRHHPSKRNPWNEIECGDHYSRAMASYGVYVAASGYEHHGPKGHLGFAPRLTPEDFRAAFTAAEGWGTFSQQLKGKALAATVELKWGKLRLKTFSLAFPDQATASSISVDLNDRKVEATLQQTGSRVMISLPTETTLQAQDRLHIALS